MSDFPANSIKKNSGDGDPERPAGAAYRPRPDGDVAKRIEKITTGEVSRRKRPLGRRISDMFFGGDAKSALSYAVLDVILPAAKDTIVEASSAGIERMIFGGDRAPSRRGYRGAGSRNHTPYNRYSQPANGRREEVGPTISKRGRATHDFDEIILDSRAEAEDVLSQLFEIISKYNVATVSDLYAMVGITANYTDDKYGWADIQSADVVRLRSEGYLLKLPRPEPLDRI